MKIGLTSLTSLTRESNAALKGSRVRPETAPLETFHFAEVTPLHACPVLDEELELRTCPMQRLVPIFDRWFTSLGYASLRDWEACQWEEVDASRAELALAWMLTRGRAYANQLRTPEQARAHARAFVQTLPPPSRMAVNSEIGSVTWDPALGPIFAHGQGYGLHLSNATFEDVVVVYSLPRRRLGMFVSLDED